MSRDVIFFESIFPYKHSNHALTTSHTSSHNHSSPTDIFDFPYILNSNHNFTQYLHNHDTPNIHTPYPSLTQHTTPNVHTPDPPSNQHTTPSVHTQNTSSNNHTTSHANSQHPHSPIRESSLNLPDLNFQPKRSSRFTHALTFLQDYHCNLIENAVQSTN